MDTQWWKDAVGYQIWPASFCDSNHDGIGDIVGITSKLDHLRDLGIDLIWLSPVYDSPQHDMGYDVRNYEDIWEKYGTLEDMENLIAEAHKRGIRVVMDLVINHCSNEHRWFLESRKSRTNPYSDWYIWRDPKYDANGERQEPCNWRAAFGGSVWEYGPERDQYYLHLALPQQPDFNWLNPATREAIFDTSIDFWLRRGVDGFRMDVVNFYWKNPLFPDSAVTDPKEKYQRMEEKNVMNGPPVHDWLKEIRRKIKEKYGDQIVLIGELPATEPAEIMKYISPSSGELDMVLDMDIFMAGNGWNAPLHDWRLPPLPDTKDALIKTQALLEAWTTVFTENHDNTRSVSRYGPPDGSHREQVAKTLAMLLCTLSGTIFVHQGQEIGMTNMPSSWKRENLRDQVILRYLDKMALDYPGDQAMQDRALKAAVQFGRDNGRTPVQWNAEAYAGFSSVRPWIDVNDNYTDVNVAEQRARSGSALMFWRRMISVRREYREWLIRGRFEMLDRDDERMMCYLKLGVGRDGDGNGNGDRDGVRGMFVALNFSSEDTDVRVPERLVGRTLRLVVSSMDGADHVERGGEVGVGVGVGGDGQRIQLKPWEGRLYSF